MKDELVFGVNPVREALRGTREVHELFVQASSSDHRMEKILALAKERGVKVCKREREDLTRMCGSSHHQGMALRVASFPYAELEDMVAAAGSEASDVLLVLDGIQDPHNLGALIRSAACAGAHGVIIPKDRACGITPVAEKSSAGAVETIPVAQVTNVAKTLETLKKAGYWVYGLAGEAGQSVYDLTFSGKVALVIGSEGEGIRPLVRKQCDVIMSIPQFGGVASLNASVAGGIALFEVARGLREKP
ncbi:23S rRNA (guanosine(2251)-2'-O)-methyltransferase RlmB [Geobacter sp. SVR]|uniref:23S rRNA (guanosine(2251)-2'-O)-methyltransferase RlmB n=1 Tax=Geobacter sp. SVR TaxID=2495594 RepID=UPI00143EFFF3|nr:23S rRNA (guanosine(2251)-2'-O)-methyltransferase RlmB [Geobacter sp. SVR]BCS53989.1 23S rRNA (guanosine(2251)-2'-O)-methyltransferase RlmB [Geobacter sp. SVR]GCF86230.1 23S rRNA (guanosine(2251)-2'-O)-methyltransferase RlmB [Geobacter sp. SVR]